MEDLKTQIRNLPDQPGVYRYYDVVNNLLYIGKARNLKKRVSSYFTSRSDHVERIRIMVSKIRRIEYTVVGTEYDALLLENSLIKEHQPHYNVALKDGKGYPYIAIKNERFPRVFYTRNRVKDGTEYFGPYANVSSMHTVLELIRKLFPTRSCNFLLSKENIAAHKFRVCLDYHIGLCKGPCDGFQSEEEYNRNLEQIRQILKGKLKDAEEFLRSRMQMAVGGLDFEQAQELKDKLDLLVKFQARSTVVNPMIDNVDVFSIYSNDNYAFVNYLHIVNGSIITTDTVEYRKKMQEEDAEILMLAMVDLRDKYQSRSKEIILPFHLLIKMEGIKINVPLVGDKKKLLDLSRKNAFMYFQDRIKSTELNKDRRRNFELLTQVKNDLNLKELPYHIECFDNSNIQGTFPVSAIVVFKNGVPAKKEYRFFNVKSVEGPNDFATMEEAVFRRYSRMLEEEQPLPQLIIIDGGKGQLSAALKSLQALKIDDRVDLISIAKRLEEIYKPGDPLPLAINKKSQSLRLIQRARDEAHNYGVSQHRRKRIASSLQTGLEDIPGIGKVTAEKLLKYFKSVKKIREATLEDLEGVIGKARAQVLLQHFRNEQMGK